MPRCEVDEAEEDGVVVAEGTAVINTVVAPLLPDITDSYVAGPLPLLVMDALLEPESEGLPDVVATELGPGVALPELAALVEDESTEEEAWLEDVEAERVDGVEDVESTLFDDDDEAACDDPVTGVASVLKVNDTIQSGMEPSTHQTWTEVHSRRLPQTSETGPRI